jgi:integrase
MATTTCSRGLQYDELVEKYLSKKASVSRQGKIKEATVRTYRARLLLTMEYVGVTTLVADIGYEEIESFLVQCDKSQKTISEAYRCLREVFMWGYNIGSIETLPRFPQFSCPNDAMRMRETVDKGTQTKILCRIHENEWERAPRKYLACKMLATYVNIRPGELRNVRERDYDPETGYLTIRRHKTGQNIPKVVKLLDRDRRLLEGLPRGVPEDHLFRYDKPFGTVLAGDSFGVGALYRCWKRAAVSLGHSGVDLYGGTRHSSCIALYKEVGLSPEQIRRASGTRTSKAFMRYLPLDVEDVAEIHKLAEPGRSE